MIRNNNVLWKKPIKLWGYLILALILPLSIIILFFSFNTQFYQKGEPIPLSITKVKADSKKLDDINNFNTAKLLVTEDIKLKDLATIINKQFYADEYFVSHSDFRRDMVEYCSETAINSQTARLNCNSASKVNQIWYLLAWYASGFIRMLLSSAILMTSLWIALAIYIPLQILSIIFNRRYAAGLQAGASLYKSGQGNNNIDKNYS